MFICCQFFTTFFWPNFFLQSFDLIVKTRWDLMQSFSFYFCFYFFSCYWRNFSIFSVEKVKVSLKQNFFKNALPSLHLSFSLLISLHSLSLFSIFYSPLSSILFYLSSIIYSIPSLFSLFGLYIFYPLSDILFVYPFIHIFL